MQPPPSLGLADYFLSLVVLVATMLGCSILAAAGPDLRQAAFEPVAAPAANSLIPLPAGSRLGWRIRLRPLRHRGCDGRGCRCSF